MRMVGLEKLCKWDWVKLKVSHGMQNWLQTTKPNMNLSCQIFIKGFTVQKIARMKNGINRYEKVRIDLGWKPKECLQSYKEFCQSLDIFGVVHVHVCAQHRRAGVSAAVNFFGASTRLRRVSAPKKLTAASTPALLCFAHTCTYISYTKNVSWLAKFFMWLATFFMFHPRCNNVLNNYHRRVYKYFRCRKYT